AACNGSLGKALLMASSGESPVVERAREVLDAALREPVSGVLAMCSALARKHGAEGVLDLVMELRALVHDLIRRWHGKCCLYHPEEDLPDLGGDRERYLVEMTGKLDTCERRIRRNVAPSMALEAALLGARAGAAG
ncbi:hypothetical protein JW921_06230, partial [Candidatus Fermentibacterales bacterium]|nr:hypothetical protein [Candidatus Fermentibacterales bacterium]